MFRLRNMLGLQLGTASELLEDEARCKNELASLRSKLARISDELDRLRAIKDKKYQKYSDFWDYNHGLDNLLNSGDVDCDETHLASTYCPYGSGSYRPGDLLTPNELYRRNKSYLADLLADYEAASQKYNLAVESNNDTVDAIEKVKADLEELEETIELKREQEREAATEQRERERVAKVKAEAERQERERHEKVEKERLQLYERKKLELTVAKKKHQELREQYEILSKKHNELADRVSFAQEEAKRELLRLHYLLQKKEEIEKQIQQLSSQVNNEGHLSINVSVPQLDLTVMSAVNPKDPRSVLRGLQAMMKKFSEVNQKVSEDNNRVQERQQEKISMLEMQKKQIESDLQQEKSVLEAFQIKILLSKQLANKTENELKQSYAKIEEEEKNVTELCSTLDGCMSGTLKNLANHAVEHSTHVVKHVAKHIAEHGVVELANHYLGKRAGSAISGFFNVLSVLPSTEVLGDGVVTSDEIERERERIIAAVNDKKKMQAIDVQQEFKAISRERASETSPLSVSAHTFFPPSSYSCSSLTTNSSNTNSGTNSASCDFKKQ